MVHTKANQISKKGIAYVLTLALVLSFAPSFASTKAYAASAAATPSVSTYATKAQLKNDTFRPNDDGTATNIGKINFGGKAWYLLGGSGNNVDVFAAQNFGTAAFQDTIDTESFKPDTIVWGSVDYGTATTKPSTVYPNNYGASDLRGTLQTLASGDIFNAVEKGMMNETTVTTTDLKNKAADDTTNLTYTTKDKLYAASGGDDVFTYGGTTIDVNGKTLDIKNTYKDPGSFWLRSPSSNKYYYALDVTPADGVYNSSVSYITGGVRPASNLDFSSVLFASAAPASSSDKAKRNISSGTAMNLRLEATENTTVSKAELGEVSVNTTEGTITATKGSGAATLVVQGNDDTNDWYYTKSLSEASTTVSASDIATGVDLAKCKVWLEQTGSDGMIYAVETPKAEFEITTSATNGTIDATQTVTESLDKTINYNANTGYELFKIEIDGTSLSDISQYKTSYTFTNVTKAHTIAVTFTPINYTITYNAGDDATNPDSNPKTYNVESADITFAAPTKVGYTFKGWYDASDNKVEGITKGSRTGDLELTAKWEINKYTVKFVDYDGTTVIKSQEVEHGKAATAPDDPIRKGYTFTGWSPADFSNILDNTTITAQYEINKYKVTFDANGGSFDGTETKEAQVEYGQTVTAPDPSPTRANYTFTKWTEDKDGKISYNFEEAVSAETKLYAQWQATDFDITYNLDGGTNAKSNPSTYNVETADFTFVAPTKDGYTFLGWFDANNKQVTGITKGSRTGALELTAQWQKDSDTSFVIGDVEYIIQENKKDVYIKAHSKKIKKLVIPTTVQDKAGNTYNVIGVAKAGFKNCKNLKKVSAGKGIRIIKAQGFANCKKLKTFKCSSKVLKSIGNRAFIKCKKLKKATFKSGALKEICNKSFNSCKKLKKFASKSKVLNRIGVKAFGGCKNLKNVTLKSKKLSKIATKAFYKTPKLTKITINKTTKLKIVKSAFKKAGKNGGKGLTVKVKSSKKKAYKKLILKKGGNKKLKVY